jgi:threonine dehydrogenase-like Zn-dependent dehydrogenase
MKAIMRDAGQALGLAALLLTALFGVLRMAGVAFPPETYVWGAGVTGIIAFCAAAALTPKR